ncbi:SDR family oxidoreductase [Pseudoalteromonas xiamenensis]|uniref:SDR family oxidoreductase n=1 Tax=Pseudoalteromonas xiamenensis TaxID=882626 RepID=A0A975DFH1_9GAMM|nr:SDR family oxidoreductase [Pseudoalteromonas xiamenensis]QTH70876.1 SDR family oxidoreductase [Pseudoalteromonas xiamenensis]WMN59195.1 SDR family oxidoreductase [Pseudoalteromonas xiamenensis]
MENLKIAIVTGAFGGIGTAIVKELIEEQCFVLAVASAKRTSADFDAWLNEHQINPTKVKPLFIDVTDQIACENALSDVIDSYGHVDILVNNAGITRDSTFKKMSASQWNEVINTNLNSLFNMTQPLFAQMCARKFGRIINISSVNGQKGQFGQANYSAAKAGMIGFSKALAYEGARANVTVNVVAPGYTETPMVAAMREDVLESIKAQVPMQRLATPLEVAQAVAYLASDKASYITGETLALNGGLYMQ